MCLVIKQFADEARTDEGKLEPVRRIKEEEKEKLYRIQYYKGDVLDIESQSIPGGEYKLVVVDPPYGLRLAHWDNEAWALRHFEKVLQHIQVANKSSEYVVVLFCSAFQISTVMTLCKTAAAQAQQCCWVKTRQGDSGRDSGQLVNAFELFVVAYFSRNHSTTSVGQRLCQTGRNLDPDEKELVAPRSNVFVSPCVKHKFKNMQGTDVLNPR
jgi:hypothetical protein